ncbi:MAG TPA: sigma-54-dependent Fis family transcriptional regulator [Candidatus Binataceae bacterium]|nr:sigma-54-dependent Fis family transcriptional regulator [Candidatus Binataceae bacterium]
MRSKEAGTSDARDGWLAGCHNAAGMERNPRDPHDRVLYDLARAFAAELDLDLLIPLIIRRCRDALDAGGVSVMLLDRNRGELYFPYNSQDAPEVSAKLASLRFPANRGIAGSVLETGRAERVDDPANDPRFNSTVDHSTGITTRSILAAPLIARGQPEGVIEAVNHRDGPFTDSDLSLLQSLADVIAIALCNADLFATAKKAERALRKQVGALRLANREFEREIVGTGPAMEQVFKLIGSAASSSIPVLIEGETGTGKELVARAVHQASDRAAAPFIAINCAAFAEGLLESELFGHRRGAFTGATTDEPGLFRAADGGVVLLDEIGEMPLPMQAKLLRVLQEGEVTPVGAIRPQKIDVRVLSATNRDLAAAVAARTFREDLFYRLAVFPIRLPPLRERREDIVVLVNRFLEVSGKRSAKRLSGFEPAALDALTRYDWPGNVRQLQNEIERAVALTADGQRIGMSHLSAAVAGGPAAPAPGETAPVFPVPNHAGAAVRPLAHARADFEANYIAEVLAQNGGKIAAAARALGISREALHKRIKKSAR